MKTAAFVLLAMIVLSLAIQSHLHDRDIKALTTQIKEVEVTQERFNLKVVQAMETIAIKAGVLQPKPKDRP